jgi:hypothetical protein
VGEWDQNRAYGDWVGGGGGLDSTGSGQGPVVRCCECGDEPSGSCATELVAGLVIVYVITVAAAYIKWFMSFISLLLLLLSSSSSSLLLLLPNGYGRIRCVLLCQRVL